MDNKPVSKNERISKQNSEEKSKLMIESLNLETDLADLSKLGSDYSKLRKEQQWFVKISKPGPLIGTGR